MLAIGLAACEPPPLPERGPELDLGTETTRLPGGTEIHEIQVRSHVDRAMFDPSELTARPGDVIRFIAADAGTHAVAFDETSLAPEPRAFLERTGQLRGPPLIATGAAWIVSLEDAPPGVYPYTCLTHGGAGRIVVQAP